MVAVPWSSQIMGQGSSTVRCPVWTDGPVRHQQLFDRVDGASLQSPSGTVRRGFMYDKRLFKDFTGSPNFIFKNNEGMLISKRMKLAFVD